jgi:cell division protein FtsI/penicillin-binding protein 2
MLWLAVLGLPLPGRAPAASQASRPAVESLPASDRVCLAERLRGAGGQLKLGALDAFAVMDPHSGRILWLGNPRILAQADFQPGSIFKVITAYAALTHDRVDPHVVYRCSGWQGREGPAGNQVRCWLRAGHGPVNLAKALAYSCNLYFAMLAGQLADGALLATARDFGLGRATGSDLPGEVPGSLPLRETLQDSGRLGIGQGEQVTVTGLQVLSLIGALANGGVLLSPRESDPGGPATSQRGVLADSQALRFLLDALEQASAFGTGAEGQLGRLAVAGKTGTAAWRNVSWRTHGWYMGVWPARRPLFALVVFVHKGFGSHEAAAAARAIVERVNQAWDACQRGAP